MRTIIALALTALFATCAFAAGDRQADNDNQPTVSSTKPKHPKPPKKPAGEYRVVEPQTGV